MNDHETELWNWFLFKSFLTPQRAKALLYEWEQRGLTLQHVLDMPPEEKGKLGLSQEEAGSLHTPSTLPACAAIRRNEPEYPRGLCKLPPKVQPALLFYAGERTLLTRPILYLPPLPMASEEDTERTREVLSLLLGEGWLPAAVRGSMQADLLLKEMRESEGEALLFVRSGLKQNENNLQEATLLESHRLVLITPLPPEIPEDPKIEPVLSQVENAAASVCIVVGSTEPELSHTVSPTAWVNTTANHTAPASTTITLFSEPMELLMWLANQEKPSTVTEEEILASELPALPPLPPEEALQILEQGGRIPEALRKRLLGED